MKTLFAIALSLICITVKAEEVVVSGDGKQFKLNDNGTWEVVSEDRIIDTQDGRRVVLKIDGTWQYLGMAPEVNEEKFQNLLLSASIDRIEIAVARESAGPGKNSRIKSTTSVILNLSLASTAGSVIELSNLDINDFLIRDNRNKEYPIVLIESASNVLQPGKTSQLTLVSDKAPSGLRKVVDLILEINVGAVGNTKKINLSYDYDRINRIRFLK